MSALCIISDKYIKKPQPYFIADTNRLIMAQLPALRRHCVYLGEGWIHSVNGVVQRTMRTRKKQRLHFWAKKEVPFNPSDN